MNTNKMKKTKMKTTYLYHYTDFSALNGILCNRELRVNNVLNMNDAEEMQLFMKGLLSAVENKLMDAGETVKAEQLKKRFSELEKRKYEYSAYAACFSTYRDDASQWERYANKGKGVCVGIRRSVLEKMTNGAISLHQVFYSDDIGTHPLVDKIFKIVMDSPDISTQVIYGTEAGELLREAWHNSASFKHPSFSSEHEFRLVVMPFNTNEFNVKPRYHIAKDRIKKYYPLDLVDMCSRAKVTIEDLITEIIVGPESTQSLPILKDYLRDMSYYKLSENICTSVCPLRSKLD